MGKTSNGTFRVPGGLEVNNNKPVDDRLVVETDTDLLVDTNADGTLKTTELYKGIIVYSEESETHFIWNGQNRSLAENWIKLSYPATATPPLSGVFSVALDNFQGTDYSGATTNLTSINIAVGAAQGGNARIKGNWASKPTVTGATELDTNTFAINTVKYMYIEQWADGAVYWYSDL